MAEAVYPPIDPTIFLRTAMGFQNMREQAQMAPYQLAQAQQQTQAGALNLEQLRMAMAFQRMRMQMMQNDPILNGQQPGGPQPSPATQQAGAQNVGGTGAGIASGPQAQVASPAPTAYGLQPQPSALDPLVSPSRLQYAERMANYGFKDPQEAITRYQQQKSAEVESAQKQRQVQVQQNILPLVNRVINDPNADRTVDLNPTLKAFWAQYRQEHGLDTRPSHLTVEDAQRAAWEFGNRELLSAGMPAMPPLERYRNAIGSQGQNLVVNTITGKPEAEPGAIEQQRLEMARRLTEGFSGKAGDLLASLTLQGVSLPAGLRSKEQQVATLQGLIKKYPDLSPDEIAAQAKAGKIDMAGQMKETTVAGGIAGKVRYAENELSQSIPLALEASQNVPRGKFVPLNRLLQMANTAISDPDLLNLKIKTQSVLNAYDMLAARGGTDVGKRSEQHALLESAQSPEAFAVALRAFEQEAQVARKASELSMRPPGATPPTAGWSIKPKG